MRSSFSEFGGWRLKILLTIIMALPTALLRNRKRLRTQDQAYDRTSEKLKLFEADLFYKCIRIVASAMLVNAESHMSHDVTNA